MNLRQLDESYFAILRFYAWHLNQPVQFSSKFFVTFVGNRAFNAPFIFAIISAICESPMQVLFDTLPLFFQILFIHIIINSLVLLTLSAITRNKKLCIQHQKIWMLAMVYTYISIIFNIACLFLLISGSYKYWITYIVLLVLVLLSFAISSYQLNKRLQQGFYKAKKYGFTPEYPIPWKLLLMSLIIIIPYFLYLIHLNSLPLYTLLSMMILFFLPLGLIMLFSHYLSFYFLLIYCAYRFPSFTITEDFEQ